jgi:hypothetical protein
MSKPMTRIAFSLLIALALMIAIYSSVQGANATEQTANARASAGANFGISQTSMQEFNTYDDLGEGDCHHDSIINPEDY